MTWPNAVFSLGFVIYVIIRGVFEQRTKDIRPAVSLEDWRERALLVLVFIGCMLLPALYLFSSWLKFADYRAPSYLAGAGSGIIVLALWLFWRSHKDLGINWSRTLELRSGHHLVDQGVYRRVRHPMYSAIILFCIAQGFLLHNWLAGWSGLASFLILYLVRVSREEQLLCEYFGDAYRSYMQRTGRLLPRRGMTPLPLTPS